MKCKPIANLLSKTDGPVQWTDQSETALTHIINDIVKGGLKLARFDLPFIIYSDWSCAGIGAVLVQEIEGQEYPIMFASRTLV